MSAERQIDTAMLIYLRLLQRRPGYRRLWLGELISLVGDWLSYVAISLLAFEAGHGAMALAVVFLGHVLPAAVVSPVAGVVADRFGRRRLLVAIQLLQAAVMLVMVAAAAAGSLLLVEAMLVLRTAASGFVYPAKQAAIEQLVEPAELVQANALDATTWSVSFAVGTALGGVLALAGPVVALATDALTFVIAALIFARLPPLLAAPREPGDQAGAGLLTAARELLRRPRLLEATLAKTPLAMAGGAAWILLNMRAHTSTLLGSAALSLGLLQAVRGIGTGVGPMLAARLVGDGSKGLSARRLLWLSFPLMLLGVAWFTLAGDGGWLLWAAWIWGLGSGINWVMSSAEIQRLAPRAILGRASAIDQLSYLSGESVAVLLAAWLVDRVGDADWAGWVAVVGGSLATAALAVAASARGQLSPELVPAS